MAIAYVQNFGEQGGNATGLTTATSFTSTTGNLLIVSISIRFSTGSSYTFSDSGGLTWTKRWEAGTQATSSDYAVQYTAVSTGTASQTFTTDFDGSNSGATIIDVMEISGQAASPFDQSATNVEGSGNTNHSTGNTGTLAQANNLIVGFGAPTSSDFLTDGTVVYTATGWTIRDDGPGSDYPWHLIATKITSATTALSFDWTTSKSVQSINGVMVYKEATAATSQRHMTILGVG